MPDFDHTTLNVVAYDLVTAGSGASPHYVRSALNRAYYSQYGYLRRRITDEYGDCFGGIQPRGPKHNWLYGYCSKSAQANISLLGQHLKVLCELRVTADYKWKEADEPTHQQAADAVELADRVKDLIRALAVGDLQWIHDELAKGKPP
jgi:hypothetical protein